MGANKGKLNKFFNSATADRFRPSIQTGGEPLRNSSVSEYEPDWICNYLFTESNLYGCRVL